MNLPFFITRLAANRLALEHLLFGIDDEQARWKPTAAKWSILEVVNHLYDEERDDFRKRLSLVWEDPTQAWPSIDPHQWAIDRKYNERDLVESVQKFLAERDQSLRWLETLATPDWEAAYQHPRGFTIRAGDLLTSWVGHDLLHIRQISELHWKYLGKTAQPFSPDYAGEW